MLKGICLVCNVTNYIKDIKVFLLASKQMGLKHKPAAIVEIILL